MGMEIVKATDADQALYRFFATDGQLLYVGISADPFKRMAQHRHDKAWWHEVAQVTIERFPTRKDALRAESIAIRDEGPRYNIARPPEPRPKVCVRFTYFEPAVDRMVTVLNVAPIESVKLIPCHNCGNACPPRRITELANGELWSIGKCSACGTQVLHQDPPTQHRLEPWTEAS